MDFEKRKPQSNQEQYLHLPKADEKHEKLPKERGKDFLTNPIYSDEKKREEIKKGEEDGQKQLDTIRKEIGLKMNARTEDISPGEQVKSSTRDREAAKEVIKQRDLTAFELWIEKIKKQEEIGHGAQKHIFIHPDDPRKIVAIFHTNQSVYDIKERFYVNKILHLLYPNNIPDIHLAASQPAVLVIDRVVGERINLWNLKHRLSKIIIERRLKKIGILIDTISFNFMTDQNGKVFYIDDFIGNFNWNKEKLLKTINKLRSKERQSALSYLNRIEILKKIKKNNPK